MFMLASAAVAAWVRSATLARISARRARFAFLVSLSLAIL
jgi:hypothetical protein